jgi:hypothetical protein
MAAKGRNKKKTKVIKNIEKSESSDEDVDLDAMERMLNDSDSDSKSDEESDEDSVAREKSSEEEDDGEDQEDEDSVDQSEEEKEDEDDALGDDEKCNIDLRNLLAFNTHQMNHKALYKKKGKSEIEETTILVDGAKIANEDFLLEKASNCCTQLLAKLWKLETEKTDVGPMAILPSYFETVTPRELVSSIPCC